MPKITLINTESGKPEDFEPVDAREILANPKSIYKVPAGASEQIGVPLDPNASGGINIPQMHGADAEMQTGLTVDKYARQAVVKALPGNPVQKPVLTTSGQPIDDADDVTTKMKVVEIKAALDAKGISYSPTAKKADLQALLDAAD